MKSEIILEIKFEELVIAAHKSFTYGKENMTEEALENILYFILRSRSVFFQ